MLYSRINLHQTYYPILGNWGYITNPNVTVLNIIYQQYCRHKQFESVMPIFDTQYTDDKSDVIGYYDKGKLVAFSLIKRHDNKNAEAIQFAWNYENPKLRLGIESLKNECAIYKSRGYTYLYLGTHAEYKRINGYELLGKWDETIY